MAGPGEFLFDIEGQRAVDVDVFEERRGEVEDLFVTDGVAFRPESRQGIAEVDGVEQDHCVGHDREAKGPYGLGSVVASADVALVGVEQAAAPPIGSSGKQAPPGWGPACSPDGPPARCFWPACSGRILGRWFDLGLWHGHDRHPCVSRWLTGCW